MTFHDPQPSTSSAPEPPVVAPPPRRRRRRLLLGGGLALTLALGGTTAWALDRFVVEHVEIADVSAYEASQASASGSAEAATSSGTSDAGAASSSDGTSVSVRQVVEGTGDDTVTYYVADVVLGEATDLRSAFAQYAFGENITEKTSDIAADNDALFAINGDYYGFRSTGIVIRNGVVYRDEGAREGLAFYRDGSVEVFEDRKRFV